MRLSLKHLNKICQTGLSAKQAAETLTRFGLEVEEIIELGHDTALMAEVTSNRPDWNSHIGVARDLAAATGSAFAPPDVSFGEVTPSCSDMTSVAIEDFSGCPCYTARIITDVKVAESPAWLQEFIESIGLRPVNNVVDITNLVLFECGQPLHAFDFDALEGGKIIVRRARNGEMITSIDDTKHELCADDLVIADGSRPVAVAGVMGGIDTEIKDTTTTILLESAIFDPQAIKATSRRLDLASDSSFRFERRVDPGMVEWGSNRAAALITELAGGKIHEGLINVSKLEVTMPEVTMRYVRIKRLLGMAVEKDRVKKILGDLGFKTIKSDDDSITVEAPTYRADVRIEADLIEEVARIVGYDNITADPTMRIRSGRITPSMAAADRAAEILSACGFLESVTFSFTTKKMTERFSVWPGDGVMQTRTTVRVNENSLRKTLMPSLLESYRLNRRRGNRNVKLLEISRVFLPKSADEKPDEKTLLALVDGNGFRSAKGAVQAFFERFGLEGIDTVSEDREIFEKGISLSYKKDGRLLGVIGKLSAAEAERLDIQDQPVLVEIDFDMVIELQVELRRYSPVPTTPASRRDLAIVVGLETNWADVASAIEEKSSGILESIEFFDEYRGSQVPKGMKSLAFNMCFRDPNATLSSEAVDEEVNCILAHLNSKFGATLRSQ